MTNILTYGNQISICTVPVLGEALNDGHTVAWYDYNVGITKSIDSSVSVWADSLGSGNNLVQATVSKQPKWDSSNGVCFNISTTTTPHSLLGTFAYNQPEMIYVVMKTVAGGGTGYYQFYWDGIDAGHRMGFYKANLSSVYGEATGVEAISFIPINIGNFFIARVLYNSFSSFIKINNYASSSILNVGTLNSSGIRLGGLFNDDTVTGTRIQVKELILRNVVDSGYNEYSIYNYLRVKYFGDVAITPKKYILISGFIYENETLALVEKMTTQPTLALKTLINTTFKTLKDAAILPKLDVLTFYGVHTSQAALLDWKRYKDQAVVANTHFVPGMGFRNRDGLARYINTNFNPSTNGVNYQLSNAMYGCYIKDYDENIATKPFMGSRISGQYSTYFLGNPDTSGLFTGGVNASDGGQSLSLGNAGYGMLALERTSSSIVRLVYKGESLGNKTQYLGKLPTDVLSLLTGGPGTAAVGYSKSGFQASFMGSSLTDAEHTIFHNAIKNFVDNAPSTFTPKTDYLDVINDGNTVAWYDSDASTATMTIDGATAVSRWNDKLGSGHDLIQATGTNQPLWSTDGVLFDGVDNFMKTASFPLAQPEFIYMVAKQVTWIGSAKYIFDGSTALGGGLMEYSAAPSIALVSPTVAVINNLWKTNTWGIIRVLFNGALSKLIVNDAIPILGNPGTNNMNGFTLGGRGDNLLFTNIQVKEIIIRKVSDDLLDEQLIYNYFKTKYFSTDLTVYDGDTWAWYDSDASTATMTIVGDASVSRWNDKLGSGHDLIQSVSTNRPTWTSDGVLFDGVNASTFMRTATSPLEQPESIYAVFKQITWTNSDALFDGFTVNTAYLQQASSSPLLNIYAGTALGQVTIPLDTFGIVRIKLNSTSSSIQINSSTAVVGYAGVGAMNGFALGSKGTGTAGWSNAKFQEIIIRSVIDSSTKDEFIYDYLKTKYSL